MRKYCKAYFLGDLRRFSDWREDPQEDGSKLLDETVCYLWDDFTVVTSPVQENTPLFAAVTPAWKDFCIHTLHFTIPEDLQTTGAIS